MLNEIYAADSSPNRIVQRIIEDTVAGFQAIAARMGSLANGSFG